MAGDQGAALTELLGEIGGFVKEHASGPLGATLGELGKRTGEVGEVATALGGRIMKGDLSGAALGATPFLTLVGNVVGAYLLAKGAVIAEAKLAELGAPADAAERATWVGDDDEKKFYAAKVETARFFAAHCLSENAWKAAQITSKDRSALTVAL